MMRILAPRLGEALGQTIVIDNRGGRRGQYRSRDRCEVHPRWLHDIRGLGDADDDKAL